MPTTHTVPAGLPTGLLANKVAGDDWRAAHLAPDYDVTLVNAINVAVSPAAASAAANVELYATGKSLRRRLDLTQATQVRLTALIVALGNAAGAAYKLSYMTTSASVWAGTDSGCSLIMGAGTAGAMKDSGWVSIPAGMKVDVYTTVLVGVAMGTTPPTIGSLSLQYR